MDTARKRKTPQLTFALASMFSVHWAYLVKHTGVQP